MMSIVTGDRYLDSLVKFVENNADSLIEGTLVLKLNPIGLRYVHSRFEALSELESLISGAPVDYLRAYISDLGDHRAIEQLRRILRLLPSIKVVARLPHPMKDPTPLSLRVFERLKVLELRGCDLSTSAAQGLLELRHCLEKLICHNSTDALRHVFASRIAEIKDSPKWNRLSFVSCACNNLVLMDESLQLLPAVETLDLSRNKFAKVDNLQKCTKLKHLDLGFSQLRTIASFSEVSCHIVKLVLRNNALTTLSGIEHLKSLEGLDLSYNIISSFLEIELLVGIPSLQSLWLEGNPLCTARWYRAHVFSFFPFPDKLKLDDRRISTEELWKRQILNARRQKRPASFGFYSPAKGDAELALNANSKRKSISRLVSIKNEEQSTSMSSDRHSDSDDESQSKDEKANLTEEAEVVNLMERIECIKKERSTLWLQELKEWINSGGCLDGAECSETVMRSHKWDGVGSKDNNEHTGEPHINSDSIQASADPSGMNLQEYVGSVTQPYANQLVGDTSNSYLGYAAGDYLPITKNMSSSQEIDLSTTSEVRSSASPGGSQLDSTLVPIGERVTVPNTSSLTPINDAIESQSSSLCPGSPPHYQEDILHRRQFLEEEFLQLSFNSLPMVSSDSDTSCSDHDSSECAQCIAEVDQYLINKNSERNQYTNVSTVAVKDGYNENISSRTQNGLVPSLSSAAGGCSDVNAKESERSCLSNNGISENFHDTETVLSIKHDDSLSDNKVHNKKPKRRIVSLMVDNVSDIVE
ncbi:scaffold/adaptor protein [Lithospermum erythrorhizon]|uniref:Scaffold/adaptor protein n=1 Tax=Lithospermum erythrorhizon TaxID=34254 RepID=A0AAV3RYU2_LITER